MYCVGLTGSVACGKSTVASLFQAKGVDIISADKIAKELVEPNQPAFKAIITYFGQEIRTQDGRLNRRLLRTIITSNADDRIWLENLLHPLIRKKIEQDIQHCTSRYCIIEIPLLTDRSAYSYLNRIILVEADSKTQIERLMMRDNCSKEQAIALLATSLAHDKQRHAIADDYLINNGTIKTLQQQVSKLHDYFSSP